MPDWQHQHWYLFLPCRQSFHQVTPPKAGVVDDRHGMMVFRDKRNIFHSQKPRRGVSFTLFQLLRLKPSGWPPLKDEEAKSVGPLSGGSQEVLGYCWWEQMEAASHWLATLGRPNLNVGTGQLIPNKKEHTEHPGEVHMHKHTPVCQRQQDFTSCPSCPLPSPRA